MRAGWAWIIIAVVLLALGGFVIGGGLGTVLLAAGFIALFGAGVRLISRDERPRDEPRLPAGHSGV